MRAGQEKARQYRHRMLQVQRGKYLALRVAMPIKLQSSVLTSLFANTNEPILHYTSETSWISVRMTRELFG